MIFCSSLIHFTWLNFIKLIGSESVNIGGISNGKITHHVVVNYPSFVAHKSCSESESG